MVLWPPPASRCCGSELLLHSLHRLRSAFLKGSDLFPSLYSDWFFLYYRFVNSNDQIFYVAVRQDSSSTRAPSEGQK